MHRRPDRTRRQKGFSLVELLIVVAIILILVAVLIPNLKRQKEQANETSAVQTLRALVQAETQYQSSYPKVGYACNLQQLGGNPNAPTPSGAGLIDDNFAKTGVKAGYIFAFTGTCNNVNGVNTSYSLTASPQSLNSTGTRFFCVDDSGVIKAGPDATTNCNEPLS